MPTATLLELNRLNIGGAEMYHRGVETEVTVATALRLAQDPRFMVKGLTTRDLVEHQEAQSRPRGKDLYDEIRTAADDLDPDNDDNFDRSGRPSVSALSAALGYPITAEERDAAIAQKGAAASGRRGGAARLGQHDGCAARAAGRRPQGDQGAAGACTCKAGGAVRRHGRVTRCSSPQSPIF